MHILFLSDNFPPETNAPATRLHEHARRWVALGARVTVVTCAPNFPEGKLHAGYANRWRQRETIDGIDVVRVKTYIAPNRGFARRTLDYLSFMASGSLAALAVDEPDVVVATSPQFFAAVGGCAVAALRRKPFVFELRDLWPASIRAVGAMRSGLATRALERLELALYRRSAAVVSVTDAFRRDLVARGIDGSKVHVVTNGVDLSSYKPTPRDREFARELGVDGRFVVGYLGTHGMAHALERVLDAAELLRGRDDVRFLFVGAGAAREGLIEQARRRALSNVVFAAPVAKRDMPRLWSVCDAALIHLKDTPVFQTVIPSKLFEAMGMGVPVIACAPDGELTSIVRRTRAGLVAPAEQPSALADAVELLRDDATLRETLARSARAHANEFDRSQLALQMLEVLELAAGAQRVDRRGSSFSARREPAEVA